MQNYITLGLFVLVIIVLGALISASNNKRKIFKNNTYGYVAKDIMTQAESDFFSRLESAADECYYV